MVQIIKQNRINDFAWKSNISIHFILFIAGQSMSVWYSFSFGSVLFSTNSLENIWL